MKKSKFMSRIISIVVIMALAISFTAEASPINDSYDLEAASIECAQSWALEFTGDNSVITGEAIPIYNNDNFISGYCVSYLKNGQPNGYVVVDLMNEETAISSFSIEPGVMNIYEEIKANAIEDDLQLKDSTKKRIYNTYPNDFNIVLKKGNKEVFVEDDGATAEISELKTKQNKMKSFLKEISDKSNSQDTMYYASGKTGWDAIKNRSDITKNVSITKEKVLSAAKSIRIYGQDDFINNTKSYACEVVALTNLINIYKSAGKSSILKSNSIYTSYNQLWSDTKTTETDSSKKNTSANKIKYGGTTNGNAQSGIKKYAKDRGYSGSSTNGYWLTLFSDYTRDIDKGLPCIFEYQAKFSDGKQGGHAICVMGYMTTKDTSNKTHQYLIVANGWSTSKTYLLYSDFSFISKSGFSVTIK